MAGQDQSLADSQEMTRSARNQSALVRLWHRLGSPRWFYDMTGPWAALFAVLAVLLLVTGTVWGLAFAPQDYQQGNSFRIMYLHVPAAILAQSVYMFMGVAGVLLLVWRMKLADVALKSAVPFGMSMAALALATGAVWGKPTWGAWWVWDARTTSTLVMFFLYFGLYALRQSIARPEAAGRACAVLAVVGLINIPIIKYSVDWWLTLHQSSSFSLTEKPTMPASMYLPLLVNVLGSYCLFGALLLGSMRLEILRREENTRWVRDTLNASP